MSVESWKCMSITALLPGCWVHCMGFFLSCFGQANFRLWCIHPNNENPPPGISVLFYSKNWVMKCSKMIYLVQKYIEFCNSLELKMHPALMCLLRILICDFILDCNLTSLPVSCFAFFYGDKTLLVSLHIPLKMKWLKMYTSKVGKPSTVSSIQVHDMVTTEVLQATKFI